MTAGAEFHEAADAGVTVREATVDDAEALSPLLTDLGYPTPPEVIRERLPALAELRGRALVAVREGRIVGSATVQRTRYLHRPDDLRLTSLVVAATERGTGLGRLLMREVERLARAEGCARVELTSGVTRANAHAFYEHLGYGATSRRFSRDLDAPG